MPFDAHVLYALIASPGDTLNARDVIERVIYQWNSDRARSESVVILPRRWETDTVPMLGMRAQDAINKQLVDEADIIFGVFHSRLGQATANAESGTAEEITRGAESGTPTHVYFADMPHPADVDVEQLQKLQEFRSKMEADNYLLTFRSEDELSTRVRAALEHDLRELGLGDVAVPGRRGVVDLRATYGSEREAHHDNRGRLKYRTRNERLIVSNHGSSVARAVQVTLTSLEDDETFEVPELHDGHIHPDIPPGGDFQYPLFMHGGVAINCRVSFTWTDDQGEHEHSHSVALR